MTKNKAEKRVGGASHGNQLTLFADGDEAFAEAFAAISRATHRVWMEMYILKPDDVGMLAIEAMADAARRGCDVILLLDRFGSPKISARETKAIRDAGGRVAMYNPFLPWRKFGRKIGPFSHRDHRKILLIDEVGYCGGRNVSREYGGFGPEEFHDITVRMKGPCVRDLAEVFADSLHAATGKYPDLPPRPAALPGGVFVDVLELNARKKRFDLDHAIRHRIDVAKDRCLLTTPYFVPPRWLSECMAAAARRGVEVTILTAGRSDVPVARTAGRYAYGELLEAGVNIHEMQHLVLHDKYLTVDGVFSIVGSYNVDHYGARHNLEVGILAHDENLATRLEGVFDTSLQNAEQYSADQWQTRSWLTRLKQWILHRLLRI